MTPTPLADVERDNILHNSCRMAPAGSACGAALAAAYEAKQSFESYKGSAEWLEQSRTDSDPRLWQYSVERELRSVNNAIASTPNTTPKLKQLVEGLAKLTIDFTPAGTAIDLLEAEGPFDYAMAAVGVVPGAGAILKRAKELFIKGEVGAASDLVAGLASNPKWDNAVSRADGDFGYLPTLRQNYVREVYGLQQSLDVMRAAGTSAEDIARFAYGARTDLKVKYREYTPPEILETINIRNLEKYGNELGPTFDYLIGKGKSYEQIIESATRAGGGDIF